MWRMNQRKIDLHPDTKHMLMLCVCGSQSHPKNAVAKRARVRPQKNLLSLFFAFFSLSLCPFYSSCDLAL